MSKNPLPPADFTPDMGDYTSLRPFRYWCQKVLPAVYDDSLSYYELLCKVVDFLNKSMADMEVLHGDVDAIRDAYDQLQGYVNTYFTSLDVQEEINEKLDQMFASGVLTPYFAPYVNQYVTDWLTAHVTPTSPVLDKTLTINGAAAEAHYTGHRMQKNAFLAMLGEPHDYATINRNLVIPGYRVQGVTYNNGVYYVCGGSLAENGTGFIATMSDLKFKDFQLTEIPGLGHANDITYSGMDGYLYVCGVGEGDAPVNGIWKINPNDFTDMTLIDNAPDNTVGIQYRWGDYWILAPYRIYATTDFQTYEIVVENTNDMLTQYDVPTTGRLSQSLLRTPDHIIGWVASFVNNGKHYGAITYFSANGIPIAFDMFDTFGAEMECACYANMSLWGICDGSMVTVLRADVLHDVFVQLKAGDDLDDFTGRGLLYSTGATVSGQLLHSPVDDEGFTLTVERQGLYNTRQDARTNSGRALYRTKSFNTGTWGDWTEPDAVLEGMIGDVSGELAQVDSGLADVIVDLKSNNAFDFSRGKGLSGSHNGITYTNNGDGTWTVDGTATAASIRTIISGLDGWSTGLKAGETYYIKYSSTDENVKLRVIPYYNGVMGSTLLETSTDSEFTIPGDASGIAIRLFVSNGKTVNNAVVALMVLNALPQSELSQLLSARSFNDPMLTIIDDDGDTHFLYDLVPLIQELNVPIASAVTTTRIGSASRWMSWSQIRTCAESGAEIVCHMYSHPTSSQIEAMTEPEIQHRLYMAKNYLKENGVDSNVLVYSYSTGTSSSSTKLQAAAERVFNCAFAVNGGTDDSTAPEYNGIPVTENSNRYMLPRYRIDLEYNYDLATMKAIIDDIAENGGWAVWMIHTSSGRDTKGYWRAIDDGTGNPDPNATPDTDGTGNYLGKTVIVPKLREAIQYALGRGVPLVTAEYGLKKYFKV